MSFVSRLQISEGTDTCAGFEAAAEERLWDGIALATSAEVRRTGVIYLFGYAAEMLLKSAYFRFTGVASGQDLAPALRSVRNSAHWHGRNLHDLRGWANLLVDVRAASGRPLDVRTASFLLRHAATLDLHWRETLRYRFGQALPSELDEVYLAVEWIVEQHTTLGT